MQEASKPDVHEQDLPQIAEPLLRVVVDLAPVAMILADAAGRILLANREAGSLFGYRQRELRGLEVNALVPEEQRQLHAALIAGYHESPLARQMGAGRLLQARRADGSLFPVEIALTPIRQEGTVLVLAAIVDLTARHRLERRFQQVVEASPSAMLLADTGGRIVLVNLQAERLFGYSRFELLGQPVEILIPEPFRLHHPALRAGFASAPQARPMGAGRELRGLRRDGSQVPIEIGLTPIHNEEGDMVLAAIVDISARQRLTEVERANELLEEHVRQRTKMLERQREDLMLAVRALEQSNLELKQFAYVASHDLQSPLRSISGYLELIERRCSPALEESHRGWIRSAIDAAQRMSSLIRDVLEYSSLESRARPFREVELGGVVEDALRLLDAAISDTGAVVEKGALPTVLGDRAQLVQVMQNLIGNAIKYRSAAPPRIRVSASDHAGAWAISVQDNGVGIPPESREKVFEIFRRLHATRDIPGTGIGLAICRRVVQRHGGQIQAQAAPEGGSILTFTLPRHD